MVPPYDIHPYSIQTLKNILSKKSGALPSVVDGKLHTLYFENYFTDLKAETILVENEYIDRDFMEDFAGYYARCFGKYESSCTRLHFFNRPFTSRQFSYTLMGHGRTLSSSDLQKSYLGFVVVKKLPITFIGRTCLKTYGSDNGRRFYPTLRQYPVGLFGIKLYVKETLGFQEQDRGAAACATSALWTVFQGTGKLFQHAIPSPVEITKVATQLPDEAVPGTFPSRGLTGRQEIHAIRQLGLEADYTNAQDTFNMTGSVYAYLRAGIPLLLNVTLYDTSYKPHAKRLGDHAIAVTGFSLGREKTHAYGLTKFHLKATRIDKLYVHDDQVGPFARMLLDNTSVLEKIGDKTYPWNSLSTSWKGDDGVVGSVRAVPRFLLIPLYPKIRIRFEFIRDVAIGFDKFFREAIYGAKTISNLPSPFECDIFLTTTNEFKSEIQASPSIQDSVRRNILMQSMPHYIWRSRILHKNSVLLELLFDATDIELGRFFICGVEYNKNVFVYLKLVASNALQKSYFQAKSYWEIINWFGKLKP